MPEFQQIAAGFDVPCEFGEIPMNFHQHRRELFLQKFVKIPATIAKTRIFHTTWSFERCKRVQNLQVSETANRPRYSGERADQSLGVLNIRNTKFEPIY